MDCQVDLVCGVVLQDSRKASSGRPKEGMLLTPEVAQDRISSGCDFGHCVEAQGSGLISMNRNSERSRCGA
jgi:hypothetical protein